MNNLLYDIFGKPQCRYKCTCPQAQMPNQLCESDKEARAYYGDGTPAGCFRRMLERESEIKNTSRKMMLGTLSRFIR